MKKRGATPLARRAELCPGRFLGGGGVVSQAGNKEENVRVEAKGKNEGFNGDALPRGKRKS